MMQPTFLPWQGFFELILKSDKFIFLDDFQYSVQSHHTRNKLFVNKGQVDYYNVPVQKSKCFGLKLNEVLIFSDNQWKNKLIRKLEYNYKKSPPPHTADKNINSRILGRIENVIYQDYKYLSDLNIALIKELINILGINGNFLLSSDFTKKYKSTSVRSERVMELLEWAGASRYLSAFGSYDYMKEDNFDFKKYNVIFQNYEPVSYSQIHSDVFVPYLSVLDAIFNIGPEQTRYLIENGTKKWLTPEERSKF